MSNSNNNIQQEVYINQNFNGNKISNVILKDPEIFSSGTSNRPTPNIGEKKGLLYYDTDIEKVIVWTGNSWKIILSGLSQLLYNANSGTQLSETYELPLLLGFTNDSEILNVSLNGIELLNDTYKVEYDGSYKLIIDTDLLGYNIDVNTPEDFIQITLNT